MQLTLRSATNRDRAAIESLVFGVLREFNLRPDPADTDADLQDIERSYIKAGGIFDVLVDESNRILGTVGLFTHSSSTCELRKMYLDKSIRGRGHGRRLLDHALSRVRQLGFSRVTLETARVLEDAIRLYERYGFRQYTPEHQSCRCDRAYFLDLPTRAFQ